MTSNNSSKNLLGIWDLNKAPLSLGGMLILVEELKMQCIVHGANGADICIIGDTANLRPIYRIQVNGDVATLSEGEGLKHQPLLSVFLNMKGINTCYSCKTIAELQKFINAKPYTTWPEFTERGIVGHRYGSTMFIQKFHDENGFIPYLSCKDEQGRFQLRWAINFIEENVTQCIPIVVHLKNNPNDQVCSNADFSAWLGFFKACYQRYDATFILVGNEEIDQKIRKLPNVVVTRELGGNLARDLALIQMAFIFMGMMSGPCNMAVFSNTPYIIYKNPGHSSEKMRLELGDNDRFSFATPFQKVLRIFETSNSLMSEFTYLYVRLSRQDWKKRFANLLRVYT